MNTKPPLWLGLIGLILLLVATILFMLGRREIGIVLCQLLVFIACLTKTITISKNEGSKNNYGFFLTMSFITGVIVIAGTFMLFI